MSGEGLHPAVARVVRDHELERCLAVLADELSAADLTALMLEVAERRAMRV